ncbi:MAG: DUF4197 domain-containing protein [Bacteroidales bacterium]|nr:MAG: DUF4197 domain-containing protein [Bacteroidales bacterium]
MNKIYLFILGIILVVTSGFVDRNNFSISQLIKADDVAKGLIEALKVGAQKSSEKASLVDGFYKNADIFIPFPKDAIKVKAALEKVGMKKQVVEFELSLNRAAEEACKKAFPIMLDAIKGITFTDALGILNGSKDAATLYLKGKTNANLQVAFKPVVKEAISKVKVTKYWETLANAYNKMNVLSGGKKVNPDLEMYITDKAIEGLFKLIAKEEEQIRNNPAARTTDLLKKIFK